MAQLSYAAESICFGQTAEYWRLQPSLVGQHIPVVGPPNPTLYSNLTSTPFDYTYPTAGELEALKPRSNRAWAATITQYQKWLEDYPTFRTDPFGTKFNEIFGQYADSYLTIMQALWLDESPLIRESACAYLNAMEYGGSYGYTPNEVIAHVQSTGLSDPNLLLDAFTTMNGASTAI